MLQRHCSYQKTRNCDIQYLTEIVAQIDPDVGYGDWVRVLMGIFYATGGSDEGLDLADAWSSQGSKYKGSREIEYKWRSFDPDYERPVSIGTLITMARSS